MESIRLNKYLSDAGICSRRQADRWIEEKKNNSERRDCRNGNESCTGQRGMPGWKTD